ncbi:MAG: helicase, partial [Candidatus Brocadiae bacterium]|nr:helicase [Candidatus Brocadiia bacterium]
MRIPYVIDNREHKLANILNELLGQFESRSMDIASAYFSIRGFQFIQGGLENIGSLRLLLGARIRSGEDVGLRPGTYELPRLIGEELSREPYDEQTLRLVEDLIAFLRQGNVQVRAYGKGFLHAKCYILYGDKPGERFLWDRFQPLVGIVGSSNFTGPGLTSNREMNLTHRVLLDTEEASDSDADQMVSFLSEEKASARITEKNRQLLKSEVGARAILDLVQWFDSQWDESVDFKDQLVEILNASKFGQKEYTPYQVYIKALYEYMGEDLAEEAG